jgi:hypothetical protein
VNPVLIVLMVVLFLCVFVGFWIAITAVLGAVSGWYGLAKRYPDQPEPALLRLGFQSGLMGPNVNLNGALTLSACPSGLRVGIMKVLGPFCRDFFVPWSDIRVERQARFLWKAAALRFGEPQAGALIIRAETADRLAGAVPGSWPERTLQDR